MEASDRFVRQGSLVPREPLQDVCVTIIGVGAIGRQVALQLAAMGIPQLQLIDFDKVELTNVTTQGYLEKQIGMPKVEATMYDVREIDPLIRMRIDEDRYRPQMLTGNVVFCCVDSISARSAIWKTIQKRCQLWIDARMLAEVMRILTASDEESFKHYDTTLFAQSEAQTGTCTARGVIYTAAIAAGFMCQQFSRWLRKLPLDKDQSLNLLTSELVVT